MKGSGIIVHFAYYVLARTSCVSSRLDSDLQHLAYVMYISLHAILTGSSDIHGQNGAMSHAITMRLREVGLADLEPLLRHRGITTMYALDHLSSKEASIIGQKAKQIFEIYDVSQDKLTKSLAQLVGSYDIATTECSETAMPSVLKPIPGDTHKLGNRTPPLVMDIDLTSSRLECKHSLFHAVAV